MADKELVIKISEKAYNALTHTEFDANLIVDEMRKAIVNGTPLPKGHGDLKDVKDILNKINLNYNNHQLIDAESLKDMIVTTSTIIEKDKEQEDGN